MPLFSATSAPSHVGNLRAQGPWLRDGNGQKMRLRGVTYGPFRPNEDGLPWPTPAQLAVDLAHIRTLGFNAVRVYEAPTETVLQACEQNGLHLFCWLRWGQNVDFFENAHLCQQARQSVREEAQRLAQHPAVAALLVGNEIEKNLVRWLGPVRVLAFVEELIVLAKEAAPGKLVSYASYPSTEYLIPRQADFVAFNVFLEDRQAFARYLQHIQNLAGDRPLVLTEFGLDTRTRSEAAQAETFLWHREVLEEAGATGSFWFSYTDEWQNGGVAVEDWAFGLVTKQRTEKLVCRHLRAPSLQPSPPAPERSVSTSLPSVSVIVCTRNGAATLQRCLESLACQTLPPLEVLVVDDGSTDATPEIAQACGFVRYHRQEPAGLGMARNVGMSLARGDVLAYTDDDCMADEDWLRQVVRAFDDPRCVAAGGPNLPPPPRNATEACVALAPGAPSQVLVDDFEADHLPGCNLVIRRSALQAVGGFGTEFQAAGDDVDVCWRLQAQGGVLHFVPAAVVWHHRRRTVRAYMRQQFGYGLAEALLIRQHAARFAWLGGARWRGVIYGTTQPHLLRAGAVIGFGRFGNALFQTVYATNVPSIWDWMAGLPWAALTLALTLVQWWYLALPTTAGSFGFITAGCALCWLGLGAPPMLRASRSLDWGRGQRAPRLLLWWLCLVQPMVRDCGRLSGMVRLRAWPQGRVTWPGLRWPERLVAPGRAWWRLVFCHDAAVERLDLLLALQASASLQGFDWTEASEHSVCDVVLRDRNSGATVSFATVTEYHDAHHRLTRVAAHQLPWWRSREALGVALLVAAGFAVPSGAPFWLAAALGWAVRWQIQSARLRRRLQHLVSQAAEGSGMVAKPTLAPTKVPAKVHDDKP